MTAFVALLRAVNVGGTGKLPMADLTAMCEAAGFTRVKTYIASGNVVFESDASEAGVKATLEARLLAYAGKPVGVMVRTAEEMADVLKRNPFPDKAPNRTVVVFLEDAPPAGLMDGVKHRTVEDIAVSGRELYIHYGDGMADSKLQVPAAKAGTARNINTVAKLGAMVAAL